MNETADSKDDDEEYVDVAAENEDDDEEKRAEETADSKDDDEEYVDVAAENEDDDEEKRAEATYTIEYKPPKDMVGIIKIEPLEYNLAQLESSLLVYLNDNTEKEEGDDKTAFNEAFSSLDVEKYKEEESKAAINIGDKSKQGGGGSQDPYASIAQRNVQQEEWEEFLQSKKKDLPELGDQICVSKADALTEPEAEYQVEVTKRVYEKYIVLQFNIQQTIPQQLITDVYVDVDYDDTTIINVTSPVIKCNGDSGIALSIIERGDIDDEEEYYILGKYDCQLKFIIKDDTEEAQYEEGYEDDYTLNEINMRHTDYIFAAKGDDVESTKVLKDTWNAIGRDDENRKKGALNLKDLQKAVNEIVQSSGLTPVEDSDKLDDDQAQTHALNLIAYTDKKEPMCMRAALILNEDNITYKAAVRCTNETLRGECLQSF
eukprot:CAMPEP_0201595234 /NCGR_PEP_ID=MMETSP0190_2-20130828/192302_1 /ASSEMBLY_ACC=CAM_ASM_000263 /TAXON_ID=37353 /ORGANISM="Rosalina sp." /LENGTH=430 /DNA_ID=CAMNT_0048055143 /DNA_START=257 /DNA_END=1549 /DNA_ORIENTATION=+